VTKRLEQTLGAHREKQPLPDVQTELEKLLSLIPSGETVEAPAEPAASDLPAQIVEARRAGLLVWKCRFSPDKELDARGVNINSVRERLNRLGQILQATPKVEAQKITFSFILALHEPPEN